MSPPTTGVKPAQTGMASQTLKPKEIVSTAHFSLAFRTAGPVWLKASPLRKTPAKAAQMDMCLPLDKTFAQIRFPIAMKFLQVHSNVQSALQLTLQSIPTSSAFLRASSQTIVPSIGRTAPVKSATPHTLCLRMMASVIQRSKVAKPMKMFLQHARLARLQHSL